MTEKTDMAGKPRRRRKDARPGEIIEAGIQEFSVNGFDATRLDDVAKRAGIAKGTIYRYFDSKEALFEAAVRSRLMPTLDHLETMLETFPGSSEDLLKLIFRQVHTQIVQSNARLLLRIIVAEGARFPAITEFYYRDLVSKGERVLQLIVDRGIARGEFSAGPVLKVPVVLMAPAIVAAFWRLTFEPYHKIEAGDFLDAHIDVVLNGIRKR